MCGNVRYEPSCADPDLLRELLVEQVQRREITDAEAIRCWKIHGLPMARWLASQQSSPALRRIQGD